MLKKNRQLLSIRQWANWFQSAQEQLDGEQHQQPEDDQVPSAPPEPQQFGIQREAVRESIYISRLAENAWFANRGLANRHRHRFETRFPSGMPALYADEESVQIVFNRLFSILLSAWRNGILRVSWRQDGVHHQIDFEMMHAEPYVVPHIDPVIREQLDRSNGQIHWNLDDYRCVLYWPLLDIQPAPAERLTDPTDTQSRTVPAEGTALIWFICNRLHMDKALIDHLEKDGFQVVLFPSAASAFAAVARGFQPDLIVIDLMIADSGAETLIRLFRERFTASEVPVLLTGIRDQFGYWEAWQSCGANDYLIRPFPYPEASARIINALKLARLDQQVERAVSAHFRMVSQLLETLNIAYVLLDRTLRIQTVRESRFTAIFGENAGEQYLPELLFGTDISAIHLFDSVASKMFDDIQPEKCSSLIPLLPSERMINGSNYFLHYAMTGANAREEAYLMITFTRQLFSVQSADLFDPDASESRQKMLVACLMQPSLFLRVWGGFRTLTRQIAETVSGPVRVTADQYERLEKECLQYAAKLKTFSLSQTIRQLQDWAVILHQQAQRCRFGETAFQLPQPIPAGQLGEADERTLRQWLGEDFFHSAEGIRILPEQLEHMEEMIRLKTTGVIRNELLREIRSLYYVPFEPLSPSVWSVLDQHARAHEKRILPLRISGPLFKVAEPLRDRICEVVQRWFETMIHESVEPIDERLENRKSEYALLAVHLEPLNDRDGVRITLTDDGRGWNPLYVQKILMMNKTGEWHGVQAVQDADQQRNLRQFITLLPAWETIQPTLEALQIDWQIRSVWRSGTQLDLNIPCSYLQDFSEQTRI